MLGSSKNITDGFPNVAIATYNFLLFPPDKVPAYTFSKELNCISFIFLSTSNPVYSLGIPLIAA